jgi:metal-responsive CopG/Arc/MetJ family transcriptional regulator
MRTTVDISDDLLQDLKQVAARSRRSLKDLIEDAIRFSLSKHQTARGSQGTQHVLTFKGNGVQRGVNIDSMRELLDIMDGSS